MVLYFQSVQEMTMLSTSVLIIKWTIRGKPKNAFASIGGELIIRVNSRFALNQISGHVVEQEDTWDLSASSIIGQAYFWTSRRLFATIEAGKDVADSMKGLSSRFATEKENTEFYPDPSGDPSKVWIHGSSLLLIIMCYCMQHIASLLFIIISNSFFHHLHSQTFFFLHEACGLIMNIDSLQLGFSSVELLKLECLTCSVTFIDKIMIYFLIIQQKKHLGNSKFMTSFWSDWWVLNSSFRRTIVFKEMHTRLHSSWPYSILLCNSWGQPFECAESNDTYSSLLYHYSLSLFVVTTTFPWNVYATTTVCTVL